MWLAAAGAAQSLGDLQREHALAIIELQPKIDAAIDRGVAWLLDQQQRDGSWFGHAQPFGGGQTALSAYTLMKAGLAPTHPAVRRALAHLTTVQPTKVYAAGSMLMAMAESHDPDHRPQMERIVAELIEWQRGSWGYPLQPGDPGLHGDQDLSITQFALLGLRAAVRSGIKVPSSAFHDALRTVMRYQSRPRPAENHAEKIDVAGFRYHLNSAGPSTGSMTTAGLSALWIAREGVGKLPNELAKATDDSLRWGRAWLDVNYDVNDNPNFKGQRWLYYLYGLERASALLQVAYWGGRPWYLEGARVLLEKQAAIGSWTFAEGESDTCFAILFLQRATAPATGKNERGPRTISSDIPAADVAFKVVGLDDGTPQALWVTRIGAADGTRTFVVDAVDYLVDDHVIATVPGDGQLWTQAANYRSRWQPTTRGKFRVSVNVRARRAGADGKPVGDVVTCAAPVVEVAMREVLEDWMLSQAVWKPRNQLARDQVVAAASSELDKGRAADRAVDGLEGSAWICNKDDPAPRLSLTFDKPVQARTLILTQANGARGWLLQFDLVRRVNVFVNGSKTALVAELGVDELAPTRIDLGKQTRIRRIEIAIVERSGSKTNSGAAGFAEVALEK